ncbi:MAG: N-succinylarginine dihydrolase [Gammaproteobacteria bacterium]|nr:N-succinylarginine dihydrolase [Gammaproteobacteria bacterium]NIR81658.1 N-succinylarginine dihydrolase [Gammaproteobacteria bacterium]NIR88209.1 N-succinylarginine dihydrolase [Gammaproteobacteria bacterium]NIU02770.1 N-succinylarginine dihydrolase [Gammaproteobacteria bacterium]NIV73369.1 N-succinylarginine dihydrolase [Gammaproteobacteria bacterium]
MTKVFEVNFDGLVGPTHNYAGLAFGNVASLSHRTLVSNPREAALQGLAKMRFLSDLGLPQGILPPHERPAVAALRGLGFEGTDEAVLASAQRRAPELLAACASASSMWTANAATVAPSADSADARVHFTPANLVSKLHRSIEPPTTARILEAVFPDPARFTHHPALRASADLGDEGAANHTRLCPEYGRAGLHLFVYGESSLEPDAPRPTRFPARQTRAASETVARLHQLSPEHVMFVQQSPQAIDAGVFHNDVISVGNRDVFLYHEQAFVEGEKAIEALAERYRRLCGQELQCLRVSASDLRLDEAVTSYLFNSQLVCVDGGRMALIAPVECRDHPRVRALIDDVLSDSGNPLDAVHYLDVRQSMHNGGGPACLRLRAVLTEEELARVSAAALLTEEGYGQLVAWVERHYRDRLTQAELGDPALLRESRTALDELTTLLGLGAVYPFQRETS